MADQLAYVLLNPYILRKSRTGGIMSRLLSRTGLSLVGARMFAPSRELAAAYADMVREGGSEPGHPVRELMRDYILRWYAPDPVSGRRHRVMMLLFRGDDAVEKIRGVTGHVEKLDALGGESIRETYGDLVRAPDGRVQYFEPAVFISPEAADVEPNLKLWARYSATEGGLLSRVEEYAPDAAIEQTLVLIKPDNFRFPSGRPGNIIDMFSRTGLYIIGAKVHCMSILQAGEFYGPVRAVLREKFREIAAERGRAAIERELGLPIEPGVMEPLKPTLARLVADDQFARIVRFMTGNDPATTPPTAACTERCLVLAYEGPDAIRKIREALGSTDPTKALPGTVRRELGTDIMINAAHASDSVENARREMGIINVAEDAFGAYVRDFYGGLS